MAKRFFGYRAGFHDYCSVRMYHIVLSKAEHTPCLCKIWQDPSAKGHIAPKSKFSHAGRVFLRELRRWQALNPQIQVMNRAIMPDHVHLMLFVKEKLPKPLGTYISYLTGACTRALCITTTPSAPAPLPPASAPAPLATPSEAKPLRPFFLHNFADTIISNAGQKDVCFRYITDNPKRLLARKLYPEYFRSKLLLTLPSGEYEIYGNLFLLNHPLKTVVRESRRFTEEKKRQNRARWQETMRSGGVLVSPFIHPVEIEARDTGIQEGAKLIIISTNGLAERYKPSGRFFELCEEGRLLIIAPREYEYGKEMHRDAAMRANALAEEVATLTPGSFRIRRK